MKQACLKAIAAVLLIGLGGCFTVEVPEGNFFYPDSRVRAEKIALPSAPPPAGSQSLSLSYDGGTIGATRVRATAADPVLWWQSVSAIKRRRCRGR